MYPMANPFVHVELQTTDLERSKSFYTTLFDWKLEEAPGGQYTMISVGDGTGGGMMQNPAPSAASAWLPYVLVEDVVATTEKAKSLGATVIVDVMEVPEAGWLTVFVDPTGATLGLWKPKYTQR
jgi:predicted enzyme related to lactoylglutathione lyase